MKVRKYIPLTIIAAIILAITSTSEADQKKTPIDEGTYTAFMYGCVDGCIKPTPNNPKIPLYCGCVCIQMTMNMRGVVNKYSLKYDEEIAPHLAECIVDINTVNICKKKAGM